ncbi:C2 domain-containing protein [Artemisia annua]|uniref:C2 domain-containing protein n=1 Tax=Artemisia annua TaxID=35608 RepID=A0A2U1M312_ARTAN|nr:C2 domain-containing protein [Artemisia annua]
MINNSRALELTIISAESLTRSGNRKIKKNTFVVIKTDSNNDKNQVTGTDTDNGSYPLWNEKFFIDMPMHVNFFTLEVRYRDGTGEHVVGSAKVPVSDFTGIFFPCNYLHFLSYRLRDHRYGERNGIINISVKMQSSSSLDNGFGKGTCGASTSYSSFVSGWKHGGASTSYSSSVSGWKHGGAAMNVPHGVVMGFPTGKSC